MIVEAHINIRGSRAAAWAALADIENAASFISGIEKIEILERPAQGLVGLRWHETRILFGEAATVEKRITAANEGESYETKAESDGFVFTTTVRLAQDADGIILTSSHRTEPQGFVARLKALPMVFFRGVIRKAILQDLNDIKSKVENA